MRGVILSIVMASAAEAPLTSFAARLQGTPGHRAANEVSGVFGQPSAVDIMDRVAANQDRAQATRARYVYTQEVLVRLHRGGNKLAREEKSEFAITPTPTGVHRERTAFSGRYFAHGSFVAYDTPGYKYKETDIDGEMAKAVAEDMVKDERARDGIERDLFPLTAEQQKKYEFRLEGRQNYDGHDVWRVTFGPRDRSDICWAGEALIDTAESQPVLITTWLSRGIPAAVRVLLGTNFKHLGFKVAYRKFDDAVWFPVSYGGEFEMRLLFFYKRTVSVSMKNEGFRKTEVDTKIDYDLKPQMNADERR